MNLPNETPDYDGNGKPVAYLSGPITHVPDYKLKFDMAEALVAGCGYIVLNPAVLPVGMAHGKYLPINDAMIAASDAVFLLPGWEESAGCRHEIATARRLGLETHELRLETNGCV